jgi:hypothetical protein
MTRWDPNDEAATHARVMAAELRIEAERLENLASLLDGRQCTCTTPLSTTITESVRVGGETVGWQLVDATANVQDYVDRPLPGMLLWEVCDPPTAATIERLLKAALDFGSVSEVVELGLLDFRLVRRMVCTALTDTVVRTSSYPVCDVCHPLERGATPAPSPT